MSKEGASNDNNHHSSSDDYSFSSYESEVSDSVDDYSSSDSSSSSGVGSSYDSSSSDNESRSSEHLSNNRLMDDNNNMNGSNIHRYDTQSLQSNNMSKNHTAATYRGDQHVMNNGSSKLTHRRNGKSIPQCRPDDYEYEEPSRSKYRRRDKSSRHREYERRGSGSNLFIKYICCQTTKRSTQILIFAFALWIVAQGYYFFNTNTNTNYRRQGRNGQQGRNTMERMIHHRHADENVMEQLRKQRMIEAQIALGSAAGEAVDTETEYRRSRDRGGKPIKTRTNGGRDRRSMGYNHNSNRNNNNKSRDPEGNTRTERLRDGCSKLDWHDYHYPNCNEIHEIDMRRVIEYGKFGGRRKKKKYDSSDDDDSEDDSSSDKTQTTPRQKYPWGFVGNGLWRDVFTCDPREESLTTPVAPAVLKMMKSEHKYDARNFNRHRRDALVMERLSSSHHLVPIYGYCSQTVLTQAISHTLDDVIYAREHESVKKWSPNGGYKTKPPLESWMGTDEDGELLATRETEVGRIKLALGVFRGLVDLHEGDRTTNSSNWLPVVHADLQSKQYLIDAQTGQIYLNDFNRCRFMTKKDRPDSSDDANATSTTSDSPTLKSCPLYIGSAPGSSRSPEEYSMEALSEKLDIYSAGNVLYGIITGNRPWNNERGKHVKSDIQKGRRPQVDDSIRNAVGTIDAELTRLLDRAYEHDPTKRASAREIVDELEKLLDRELKKKE